MEFSNRVAVVTGGASGIGRAAVEMFAMRGAKVAVLDVDEAGALKSLRESSSGEGRRDSIAWMSPALRRSSARFTTRASAMVRLTSW